MGGRSPDDESRSIPDVARKSSFSPPPSFSLKGKNMKRATLANGPRVSQHKQTRYFASAISLVPYVRLKKISTYRNMRSMEFYSLRSAGLPNHFMLFSKSTSALSKASTRIRPKRGNSMSRMT